MKIYIVMKNTYGDFDILQSEPIAATEIKTFADITASELNATRTDEEIRQELEYEVVSVPGISAIRG